MVRPLRPSHVAGVKLRMTNMVHGVEKTVRLIHSNCGGRFTSGHVDACGASTEAKISEEGISYEDTEPLRSR